MACIPIFPKAGNICIHTGNIVNWNYLKRNPTQRPVDELKDCIKHTLDNWLPSVDRTAAQYKTDLDISNNSFDKINTDEREALKCTVKVFLHGQAEESVIREAVCEALTELGMTYIDTLLVSIPDSTANDTHVINRVKSVWKVMEGLVEENKVLTLGVCDLDKEQLEELHSCAKVKPCINQVNLANCCVMPQEMAEFAKTHDIQLLTHNDPREILTADVLQDMLGEKLTEQDMQLWQPTWVTRYSVLIKCRGIISAKGYTAKATRDIKKIK